MILTSPLLSGVRGVHHGFSTRLGGVSSGPCATLNLGRAPDDDDANVAVNRVRFAHMLGIDDASALFGVNQVHGAEVVDADTLTPGGHIPDGDGLYTRRPRRAVGVRTADCAPVLIASVGGSGAAEAVAAVHAGWRGACANILARAVEKLGAPAASLRVAIGPTIGLSAFEVGEEVIEAARAALDGEEPPHLREGPKPHLDLRALLARQLERLGVAPSQVELVGGCTVEHPALYFSHRRDKGRTGRHLSAIYLG